VPDSLARRLLRANVAITQSELPNETDILTLRPRLTIDERVIRPSRSRVSSAQRSREDLGLFNRGSALSSTSRTLLKKEPEEPDSAIILNQHGELVFPIAVSSHGFIAS